MSDCYKHTCSLHYKLNKVRSHTRTQKKLPLKFSSFLFSVTSASSQQSLRPFPARTFQLRCCTTHNKYTYTHGHHHLYRHKGLCVCIIGIISPLVLFLIITSAPLLSLSPSLSLSSRVCLDGSWMDERMKDVIIL